MNKRFTYLLTFFVITSLLVSCSSNKETSKNKSKKDSLALSNYALLKNQSLFIDAMKAKISGNLQEAAALLNDCIQKNPENHASMYELARIYLETGQDLSALIYAEKAVKADLENKWYHVLYAKTLSVNQNFKAAAKEYEKLTELFPNEYEYYLELAYALANSKEYEKSIQALNRLEKILGLNEEISIQKQRLYLRMGNVEAAAKEIRKLIDIEPKEPKHYKLLGELYEANNMNEKADRVYQELFDIAPEDPETQVVLANYYRKRQDTAKFHATLTQLINNKEIDIDAKVGILFPYIEIVRKGEDSVSSKLALSLCKDVVKIHPNNAKSFALYGDMLYHAQQKDEAIIQYKEALELDDTKYSIWEQLLFIESELNRPDSLLALSVYASELFPNQFIPHFFKGASYLQLEKYQESINPTNQAIKIASANKEQYKMMLAQLYSQLGDAYYNLKDFPASDSNFDAALAIDPNNATVLNNYSYYLSERGDDLEKAKIMSKKSNDLEPQNRSFQDTYGWIAYKQGDYKAAKDWIKKALDNGGEKSPVVLEHYGDILFQLGEKEEALEYWKKAKEQGADSEFIKQKIADKKLYE